MPTLEQLLSEDLGAEQPSMNKEASQNATHGETDEIEKLAMEIGLVDNDEVNSGAEQHPGQIKEANMGLESLYTEMFPEDVQAAAASEKTASIDKEAAEVEEAMGKAAYDAFQAKVDQVITKIAEEKIAAGEAVDAEPAQAIENNRQGKDGKAIDTAPAVTNELPAENGPAVVGHEQQKSAAMRKHLLLSQLEK